jgi:hypothetical protein
MAGRRAWFALAPRKSALAPPHFGEKLPVMSEMKINFIDGSHFPVRIFLDIRYAMLETRNTPKKPSFP